ncbi:MAG: prolyl oligopeptidase family serine peptidase [Alphaproteobacteria bacterium]|nr:prolyl oligopeptidase family serine peptidase [Alphaproteobacteria bacterium]
MRPALLLLLAACAPPDPEVWSGPEPVPFETAWRKASGLTAEALDLLRSEGLPWPEVGTDARGVGWEDAPLQEDGGFGQPGGNVAWFVAERGLDPGDRAFMTSASTYETYVGPVFQAGYVYGDQRHRVPVVSRERDSHVTVAGLGGRSVTARLWTTDAEVVFALSDASPLDLPVGDDRERWFGVPVLNLTPEPVTGVWARVIENDDFAATDTWHPALPAAGVTQVPFLLQPRRVAGEVEEVLTARLRVASQDLDWSYEVEVEFPAADPDEALWDTFLSPIDGSVQSYGVRRPADFDPDRSYGLVLSLHGAAVQARGQAAAYSAKDWAWIVAPTNRHEFGFDWEEWGRFNALATLDHAMALYGADPTRVHLTGHSMGGHGTWHVGVTTPGRFATVTASAGWESFYAYGGAARPKGATARARAHSDTLKYLSNLSRRGAWVIHGTADDNVPFRLGQAMYDAVSEVTDDVRFHWQEGAGHWWDADKDEPGADCVDWEPAFAWMDEHRLDPWEADFRFKTPSPAYSPTHSFVTLRQPEEVGRDLVIESRRTGDTVTLTTKNVRALTLDGRALAAIGVTEVLLDGRGVPLDDGPVDVGPTEGRSPAQYGFFNQVFRAPTCFVVPEEEGPLRWWATRAIASWAALAHGSSCMVTPATLTPELKLERNLVWVGTEPTVLGVDVGWGEELRVGRRTWKQGVLATISPRGTHLDLVVQATPGAETWAYGIRPFTSRSGQPDWTVWGPDGVKASGMLDVTWRP